MKTLCIELDETGAVRVSVNGEPVGLIEELKLLANYSGKTSVDITFCSVHKVLEATQSGGHDEARQRLLANIESYHRLVADLPFVEVFDRADTLPTGMPAVRPED